MSKPEQPQNKSSKSEASPKQTQSHKTPAPAPAPTQSPKAQPQNQGKPKAEAKPKPEEPVFVDTSSLAPESSTNVKLFGMWGFAGIKVDDPGIAQYLNISSIHTPFTGRRNANQRFGKAKVSMIERLINKLMVTGHHSGNKKHCFTSGRNSGKKNLAARIVRDALIIVEKKSKRNPLYALVQAVQNGAPRAEITTVEGGGVRRPVAVDCAPQRRVDLALGGLAKGAFKKSISSKISIVDALADEIIMAAANDPKAQIIDKKTVLEKQAESSK